MVHMRSALPDLAAQACGLSVTVPRVAWSGRGDPTDPFGIGNQHVRRRETPRYVAGPADADVSPTVEQQFRLAAVHGRAKQRQRGARLG